MYHVQIPEGFSVTITGPRHIDVLKEGEESKHPHYQVPHVAPQAQPHLVPHQVPHATPPATPILHPQHAVQYVVPSAPVVSGGYAPVPQPVALQASYAGWGGYAPVTPAQVGQLTPEPIPYVTPPPMLPQREPMLVPPPLAPPVNSERYEADKDPHIIAMRGYIAAREQQIAAANKKALELEQQIREFEAKESAAST